MRGVCLERTIELDNVRLSIRDWPGVGRPLVHAPDPLEPSSLVDTIAAALAPRHRVLSVAPRPEVPYQVAATDLLGVLLQFGVFDFATVLLGERLGCVPVVLIGAWHPHGVSGLILVDPSVTSPPGERESLGARSLRECPPDWTALRASLKCDVLEVHGDDPTLVDRVEAFVSARLP